MTREYGLMGSGRAGSLVEGGPERGTPATVLTGALGSGVLVSGFADSGAFAEGEEALGDGVDFVGPFGVAQEASANTRPTVHSRAGEECMVTLTKAKDEARGKRETGALARRVPSFGFQVWL